MRVTQGMLSNNMMRNLNKSNGNMSQLMEQLNTGKKISKPSDDPVIAMKGMGYRSELVQVEQFQRNTNEVHNWMDNSDAALDKATNTMQRVRELTVKASNGTLDKGEHANIMEEVKQLKEHLVDIANTKVNDKYIFNGSNTDTPPIDEDWNIAFTEGDNVEIEVSSGTKLKANVDGSEAFAGVFESVNGLLESLESGEDISASLSEIDEGIDSLINSRADLGARMNRLELIESRLAEQEVVATQTLSNNEDVDYAETITKLITQESLHRAALSAGSKIIQPSLMDFLR